jgi:hypothetical protein
MLLGRGLRKKIKRFFSSIYYFYISVLAGQPRSGTGQLRGQ